MAGHRKKNPDDSEDNREIARQIRELLREVSALVVNQLDECPPARMLKFLEARRKFSLSISQILQLKDI